MQALLKKHMVLLLSKQYASERLRIFVGDCNVYQISEGMFYGRSGYARDKRVFKIFLKNQDSILSITCD
jgi:hypothetical protein